MLQELHLNDNPELDLDQVFSIVEQIKSLKILVLSNNEISEIPRNISKLNHIEGLVLDANPKLQLSNLIAAVDSLRSLKVLLLRNNNFQFMPQNIKGLTGLKVLELSKNNFSKNEKERIKEQLPNTKVIF